MENMLNIKINGMPCSVPYGTKIIDAARMMGIEIPINFNSPYKALTITEFWSRWHITLTKFLREYIYFPLRHFVTGHIEMEF